MNLQSYFFILIISIIPGVAMAIDEPAYTLDLKSEHFEIRKYSANIAAETMIDSEFEDAGNKAFVILAAYIFGNNVSKSKIAMMAPVTQFKTSGGYQVQFEMPNQYTLDSIPQPNDSRVKIVEVPQRKIAVYRYSGSWSQVNFEKNLKAFKSDLAKDKIQTRGEPFFARFNSPYQL